MLFTLHLKNIHTKMHKHKYFTWKQIKFPETNLICGKLSFGSSVNIKFDIWCLHIAIKSNLSSYSLTKWNSSRIWIEYSSMHFGYRIIETVYLCKLHALNFEKITISLENNSIEIEKWVQSFHLILTSRKSFFCIQISCFII